MFTTYFPQCLKGMGDICNILVLSIFGAELTKQDIVKKIFFYFFSGKLRIQFKGTLHKIQFQR